MLKVQNDRLLANIDVNNPGAAVLDPEFIYHGEEDVDLAPLYERAGSDYANLGSPCTGEYATEAAELQGIGCTEYVSSPNPDKVLVAVGNSHVQQWLPALAPIAEARNWTLIGLVRGGCQFVEYSDGISTECNERNAQALEYILDLQPDAVVTTATYSIADYPHELLPGGFATMARTVMENGIDVVGIRDNPRHGIDMALCPEDFGIDSAECNPLYESVRAPDSPLDVMGTIVPGMKLLDVDDLVCPDGVCRAVIGNVRVYLDENHLSATYSRTMSPGLETRLLELLQSG